ncbi:unnamed protein product [Bathycoccus prasinos]
MSHTPPRGGTTGFTPLKKKQAKGDKDYVEAASENMEDVSKRLFEEAKEEERNEHGAGEGSPGAMSTSSISSEKSSLAEKCSNIANEMREVAETRKREKEEKKKKEEEDIEKKEKECFKITNELDGSDFASYDDPVTPSEGSHMSDVTRRLYQEHLNHNITAVCEALEGNDNVPITKLAEQCGNYFSRHPRGLVIGHYPPSSQCGRETNVAFEIHKSATEANKGKQILRLKSACIARQAHFIAQGMGHNDSFVVGDDGDRTYAFEYVECSIKPGRKGYARLIESAALFLNFDFMDRHPTFNDNKVNPEKLIDSNLGYQHRLTGDEKFAKVVKSRQADIAKANGNTMGSPKSTPPPESPTNAPPGSPTNAPPESPTNAPPGSPTNALPVMVWNAGRVKRDSERTGAQAALFQTLIKESIEQLFGIYHPEYLMWTENPVVRMAAEETDLEICRFIEAFGGVVRVDDAFRKFVGVAECTPQERERMERECSEAMSALGMLVWMSKGRPGSEKNKIYRANFKKTEDEELSAKLAQQQVMFDGAREAAARFADLTPEEVAKLDEEGVRGLIEAHRYDGHLRAAARSQGISWADVQGVTQNEIDDMVKAYIRAGQEVAAAKHFDISDKELREMTEQQKDELIANHIRVTSRAGQEVAAAKHFDISDKELREMTEQQKDELIANHIRVTSRAGQEVAAAKHFGKELELEGMTEAEKDELIAAHNRETSRVGQEVAAAKFLGISEQDLALMDDTQKKNVIIAHIRKSTIEAAAKKKDIDRNSLAQMTKKELDDLINEHIFDGKAEAAKSWALKQKVNDTFPFTSLPLVAPTQQQQQSTAAVERYLIKLSEGEEKFGSMDKDTKNKLLKDLIAEYCYFSILEKACEVFDENFDEAKGDTWTPQERRDIIERYKFLSRGESLGYSLEAVKGMTPEMRREVKHKYNKKLLLSKLGIEADDGSDDDGDDDGDDTVDGKKNLTYAEGMEMTIEEIQTLIVKLEGGGITTQQAIRETFALSLGFSRDTIKDLSPADLGKIRVIRLQKGVQKKNIERGLFYLPGTSEHENVVKDICIALRAYGLLILSEQIKSLSEQSESTENAKFLNDWAFKKPTSTIVEYKVYRRAVFKGVVYFERLLDDVLCTGAKKNWHTRSVSLASITQYIYHKRGTFFKGTISPIILDNLPAKNLNSNQLGERTKLQRRIEQNENHVFKFAGNNDFDTLLEQLAIKSSATFRLFLEKNKDTRPWWYKRVCVQRIFFTLTRERGGKQLRSYLYYQDDSGSWLGPTSQWDIVPGQTEKPKVGHIAIVEILNALDERFENVPVASDGGEEEESEEEESIQ